MLIRTLLLAAVAAVLYPSTAGAQIYAWRDAKGMLVLSDRSLDAPTPIYAVEEAPAIRTTRPIAAGATRYEDLVQASAARESVRPELVRAVIQVESGYNARATSPVGAMGLMQLMPQTARELGVRDPYDPADNIRGGTRYLRQLLTKYDGDELLALAAYNAGPGAVDKHGKRVPPYRETRDYVRRVSARAGQSAAAVEQPSGVLYKSIIIVGDRAMPHVSNVRPTSGTFEIIRP